MALETYSVYNLNGLGPRMISTVVLTSPVMTGRPVQYLLTDCDPRAANVNEYSNKVYPNELFEIMALTSPVYGPLAWNHPSVDFGWPPARSCFHSNGCCSSGHSSILICCVVNRPDDKINP